MVMSIVSASLPVCAICFEPNEPPLTHTCSNCHIHMCLDCLQRYLSLKIDQAQVTSRSLVCPGLTCRVPLSSTQVCQWITPTYVQKYQHFLHEKQQQMKVSMKDPPQWCPKCQCITMSKIKPFPCLTKHRQCHACEFTFCRVCHERSHPWYSRCSTTDTLAFHTWRLGQASRVQSCPACHSWIEKVGGCPRLTCGYCAFEFCWFCRQDSRSHQAWLCPPKRLLYSNNAVFGKTRATRVCTKTCTALVVVTVGTIGVIVVAPVLVMTRVVQSRYWQLVQKYRRVK